VPPNPDQVAARRKLGTGLRGQREQARRTGQDLADALGWSQSKVSRIEQARTLPTVADVQALLRELRVPVALRKDLTRLAEDAAGEPSNGRHASGGGPARRRHDVITLERGASSIRHYQPFLIPGYLQTEQYARGVIDMAGHSDVERGVERQMARRNTMTGSLPPSYTIVLMETVLRWRPGSPSMMAEQLDLVAELAGQPHVDLRVLPFEGPHVTYLQSPCLIFEFDGTSHREALLETPTRDVRVTDQLTLNQLSAQFDRLFSSALTPQESLCFIRATVKSYTYEL
jgi:transcriptional regulator with XRE-family HTH domain